MYNNLNWDSFICCICGIVRFMFFLGKLVLGERRIVLNKNIGYFF